MAGILQFIDALLPGPVEALISLVIIVAGLIAIPALAWLKFVHPKGMAGRILWTIGAIVLGPYTLMQKESGGYDLYPVRRQDDETIEVMTEDGSIEVEEVPENWSRLGKRPFFITYRKSERLFRDVLSNVSDTMPDGGIEGERGGYPSFIPEQEEGYRIRVHRLLERLREAGGSRLADIAEEEGLRKFGGDPAMSNWILVAYVVVMAVLGAGAGLWFVS